MANKKIKVLKTFKRYKGFTLAEVLVTLAVIGIVAALTVPALTKSYQEMQYKNALKKTFSDLSAAVNVMMSENNGTMAGYFDLSGTWNERQKELADKFKEKMHNARTCYAEEVIKGVCWASETKTLGGLISDESESYSSIILNNGAIVLFVNTGGDSSLCDVVRGDGRCKEGCALINVDVNGLKGPNTFGLDMYCLELTKTGLIPGGVCTYTGSCNTQIVGDNRNGWGCAKYRLLNQNLP